ncbi:MAG: hypothetical protein MOGMAGMI_01265 [Candidatus Omnitrophica bacterium]|nr:hypothetical protein [Candidatus Omnitrophota bacterium]
MSAPGAGASAQAVPVRSGFLLGRAADGIWILGAPVIALALTILGARTPLSREGFTLLGKPESAMSIFSGMLTLGHLSIVFFRSHGDRQVFARHRWRFIGVPLLLFLTIALSSWTLMIALVLAVWWDVYHSSLQTFGLGRLYDLKAGVEGAPARSVDWWFNLIFYAGPVLGGASFADHWMHWEGFRRAGSPQLADLLLYTGQLNHLFRGVLLVVAPCLLIVALTTYVRLHRSGRYRMPPQKAWLLGSTAVVSVISWGFNPFGQAFFTMNYFHAVQYFAIIWYAERGVLTSPFKHLPPRAGAAAGLALLIGAGMFYGVWAKFLGESSHLAMSLVLTVSILHFWYDGFIWSVSKKQIR